MIEQKLLEDMASDDGAQSGPAAMAEAPEMQVGDLALTEEVGDQVKGGRACPMC